MTDPIEAAHENMKAAHENMKAAHENMKAAEAALETAEDHVSDCLRLLEARAPIRL